ncbi:MAG TPA: CDP-alcohol phosphatidyltransferase family protein [Gemmatimonadaceae bacterium]|nr:CDP-alcohol phosphatidyltransferase family protein [Gemmatimonadaceae bacterium]
MRRPAVLSTPNLLSLSRLPLAAAFVLADSVHLRIAFIGAASITDWLDGWIARRRGTVSRLGALLDPVADKTFVFAAALVFLVAGVLSTGDWLVLLSRDIATAVGFVVAWRLPGLRPGDFRARWAGKVVTVLQLAALVILLLEPPLWRWIVVPLALASAIAIADYTLFLHRTRVRS